MDSILNRLRNYLDNTPKDVIEKEWNAYAHCANIGPKIDDFLASLDLKVPQWEYDILKDDKKINKAPNYNSELFVYICHAITIRI